MARWYSWGNTVAVVAGDAAVAISKHGWLEVPAGIVSSDGVRISEAVARFGFKDKFKIWGEPPLLRAIRWYAWGSTLAVVADDSNGAFSIGKHGWREVHVGDVLNDGVRLSEAVARRTFDEELDAWGDPPLLKPLPEQLALPL